MSYPQASFGLPYAVFSPRNLSLNTLNDIYVLNREGSLERIFDNADMNATAVRTWGIQRSSTSTNSGSFGGIGSGTRINPTQNTQIAMEQFAGLRNPSEAFSGAMTFSSSLTAGSYYVPATQWSGYNTLVGYPIMGSHTNTLFTGTIGGRNATHSLTRLTNSGFANSGGFGIQMTITNTTGQYSVTATDWRRIEISYGSNNAGIPAGYPGAPYQRTLHRTQAANQYANGTLAFGTQALAAPTVSVSTSQSGSTTVYEYNVFWSGFTSTGTFVGVPFTGSNGYFGIGTHTYPASFKILL